MLRCAEPLTHLQISRDGSCKYLEGQEPNTNKVTLRTLLCCTGFLPSSHVSTCTLAIDWRSWWASPPGYRLWTCPRGKTPATRPAMILGLPPALPCTFDKSFQRATPQQMLVASSVDVVLSCRRAPIQSADVSPARPFCKDTDGTQPSSTHACTLQCPYATQFAPSPLHLAKLHFFGITSSESKMGVDKDGRLE